LNLILVLSLLGEACFLLGGFREINIRLMYQHSSTGGGAGHRWVLSVEFANGDEADWNGAIQEVVKCRRQHFEFELKEVYL
jgi:hypothetical protein